MSITEPVIENIIEYCSEYSIEIPEEDILEFTSDQATITPAIVLSGGAPTPHWQVTETDGKAYNYFTAGFTHNRVVLGDYTVKLLNTNELHTYVTQIDFNGDGIKSSIDKLKLHKFLQLTHLILYDNSLYGSLGNYYLPSGLIILQIFSNNLFGDISHWAVLPSGVTSFVPANNNFTGDMSPLVFPSVCTDIRMQNNNLHGDLSSVNLPSAAITSRLDSNSFTGGPRIQVASTPLATYRIENNNLSQAKVDQICLDAYNNRANFTASTPTFNVDGTGNAAPSGIYQDGDPPTTGKEYIYELVNDPESEGFNKHVWTYNP